MIKDILENLIKIATDKPYCNDLLAARKEYQKHTGEIFEDDKSYESQMALFVEWYIFERINPADEKTALESLIITKKKIPKNLVKRFNDFICNIHGIFVVKKIKTDSIRVLNLFDDKKYDVVTTAKKNFYFNKDTLFEGRLLLLEGCYYFTENFCFHPEGSKKYIKNEIKIINSTYKANEKKIKSQKYEINRIAKKLKKTTHEVQQLHKKIKKINNDKEKPEILINLNVLETIRGKQEENYYFLENKAKTFTHEIMNREIKLNCTHLILKLSHMRLLLERSRNIELNDIYKN